MNDKLLQLRTQLAALTFAQLIDNAVGKESDLSSFKDSDGYWTWRHQPDFNERRWQMSGREWFWTEKSYHFYRGIARSDTHEIYFDSKTHRHQSEYYSGLGIATKQFAMDTPKRDSWIVGITEPGKRGLRFRQWARCTEAEKVFAEFMLAGKTEFSVNDLQRLYISRDQSLGETTNRLSNIARLILERNFTWFLDIRTRSGGNSIDGKVYDLCREFDPELWPKYEAQARAQKLDSFFKFSQWIPEPPPKVAVRLSSETSSGGLDFRNSPFAAIEITARL